MSEPTTSIPPRGPSSIEQVIVLIVVAVGLLALWRAFG